MKRSRAPRTGPFRKLTAYDLNAIELSSWQRTKSLSLAQHAIKQQYPEIVPRQPVEIAPSEQSTPLDTEYAVHSSPQMAVQDLEHQVRGERIAALQKEIARLHGENLSAGTAFNQEPRL